MRWNFGYNDGIVFYILFDNIKVVLFRWFVSCEIENYIKIIFIDFVSNNDFRFLDYGSLIYGFNMILIFLFG